MKRLLLCTALLAPATLPASAQERSLWDLVHPDRIVAQMVQYAVFAARTQVDITYGDLSVSVLDGRVAMEGVEVTIPSRLTGLVPCPVSIASLEMISEDPLVFDIWGGEIAVRGVEVPASCLPPEMGPLSAMVRGNTLLIPEMTVDYRYDIPSAGFDMTLRTTLADLLGVTLDAQFAYLWFQGEDPNFQPVARLSSATLTVDNLGAWESLAAFLPPPMTNPETTASFVAQAVGGMLEKVGPPPAPKAAKAFVLDLANGMAAFVAQPDRLVIETGFSVDAPVLIDARVADAISRDPRRMIEILQPVVGASAAVERDLLPVALVQQALNAPDSLSGEDRRIVGLALLRGDRAPRNPALARTLLAPLAEAGNGEAALALARALADSDPEGAYAQALAAGPTGAAGLRSLLDRLEREMPFATRLRLQSAAPDPTEADLSGPPAELRRRARAHLRGVNAPRSLANALLYASVAAARGDRGARALLDRIDRTIPKDGARVWQPVADNIAGRATAFWLAQGDR